MRRVRSASTYWIHVLYGLHRGGNVRMIWKLKCRKHSQYKRIRKTSCCWSCRLAYFFHRGKMTRTPKPSPQQELPLQVGPQE